MEISEIRAIHRAEPFEAFNLVLRGGRKLPVGQPHHLAISGDGELLVHASTDGGFESFVPTAVSSVDFHVTPAQAERDRDLALALARGLERSRQSWGEMRQVVDKFLSRRPFGAFLLFLADGRQIEIAQPDRAAFGSIADLILLILPDRRIEILNTAYVVSVQTARPSNSGSNEE